MAIVPWRGIKTVLGNFNRLDRYSQMLRTEVIEKADRENAAKSRQGR